MKLVKISLVPWGKRVAPPARAGRGLKRRGYGQSAPAERVAPPARAGRGLKRMVLE